MKPAFRETLTEWTILTAKYPHFQDITLQVYQDLVLNKAWKTVNIIPIDSLEKFIIHAHEPGMPSDDRLIIMPIQQDQPLSTEILNKTFQQLSELKLSNSISRFSLSKITYGIVAPDSTVLYYHVYNGLQPPKES
ncbi:tRNA intron endonuclease [Cunninghamella echinulata]|nr:tRNA intron endonuclease [Cunninghamella echinulata]